MKKTCSICQKELPLSKFHLRKNGRANDSRCKLCAKEARSVGRTLDVPLRVEPTHKACTICKKVLPRSAEFFTLVRDGKFRWWQGRCKPCAVEYVAKRRKENPGYYAASRKSSNASVARKRRENPEKYHHKDRGYDLKRKYGITIEQYDAMLLAQGGLCAICKTLSTHKKRMHVDHDHETGQVRGLLCSPCNTALHKLERHAQWADAATKYLKEHRLWVQN